MNEMWKVHPVFVKYEVSDMGRVRRRAPGINTKPGRILKQCWSGPNGYLVVHPSGNTSQQVHSLVLQTFIGTCPSNCEARHLDGNKNNNRLGNLVWGTAADNAADRELHGKTARGSRAGRARLSEDDVLAIRARHRKRKVTYEMLAKEFHVAPITIAAIVTRKIWKHLQPVSTKIQSWPFAAEIDHAPMTRASLEVARLERDLRITNGAPHGTEWAG